MNRRAVLSAVARILREERLKKRLSFSAVAMEAEISYQMVAVVEKEKRNPTFDTLLRIAYAMDVDIAQVITRALRAEKE